MKKTGLKLTVFLGAALVMALTITALHRAEAGQQEKSEMNELAFERAPHPAVVTGEDARIPQELLAELKTISR